MPRMIVRPWHVLVVALAAAFVFAACAASPAPQVQPAKPAAEPAKPAAQPAKPAAEAAKPAASAPAKEGTRIVLGTTQLSSGYGIYTVAVGKLLNEQVPGANVTVSEFSGALANLQRIRAGTIDFTIADQNLLYLAYRGELKGWEGNPQKDLRLLWVFDPSANAFVVSERSGITKVEELNGKPFAAGGQGTTGEVTTPMQLEAAGITVQYYRGGQNDQVDAFKDRRIVGFIKTTPLTNIDPLIQDAMTAMQIRILAWPEDIVKKVLGKHPFFRATEIRAGVYKADWNKEPIRTWGSSLAMSASTRLPDDLAYKYTKVVLQDKTAQVAAFPALKDVDLGKLTIERGGIIPLHVGAVRALRELGYQVPKEQLPPEGQ